MNAMSKLDNLKPFTSDQDHDTVVANGRKGGINSGKVRLRKKQGRELLQTLLALQEIDPKVLQEMEDTGLAPKEVTQEVAMHIKQLRKAIKTGDTNAYSAIVRAAGYEKQEIDLNATVVRPRVIFEDEDDAVQDQQ